MSVIYSYLLHEIVQYYKKGKEMLTIDARLFFNEKKPIDNKPKLDVLTID